MNETAPSPLNNVITIGDEWIEMYLAGVSTRRGEDITEAAPDERARAGLFMAFQYPVAIPGVTTAKYLRMVMNAHREARGEQPVSLKDFRKRFAKA